MTTLNDILVLIPMEDQWIYVFDTEGNEYYEGFKGNLELSEERESERRGGKMSKICPECGKSFVGSTSQKYCSYRCCKKHNRKAKENKHPDPPKGMAIIRAFSCKECGHEVLVWERTNKRTVFCCSLCEKKYWKHNTSKSNKHRKGEIGMSGGMSLGSLIQREKRDLL